MEQHASGSVVDQVIRDLVTAAMDGGLTEAMVDLAAAALPAPLPHRGEPAHRQLEADLRSLIAGDPGSLTLYLDRLLQQLPDGGRTLAAVHARFLIAFDPATQQVIADFDALAGRRAEEWLAITGATSLQGTRAIAFCRGYKAGGVDFNLERRKQPSPVGSVVYCVEKQPLFGSPPAAICGVWEVLDVFASEASAQDYCQRIRRTYGEQPVVVRVTEKVVKA